ncbi:MAG: hypothetical protein NZM29_05485, partial [Nitrospira sp.]|nr:hypothetical protein [Nitrospira sp.]
RRSEADESETNKKQPSAVDELDKLLAYLRERVLDRTIECALLDCNERGPSKYRSLAQDDVIRLLPHDFKTALSPS